MKHFPLDSQKFTNNHHKDNHKETNNMLNDHFTPGQVISSHGPMDQEPLSQRLSPKGSEDENNKDFKNDSSLLTFEKAMEELEKIVKNFEKGSYSLEEGIVAFKRGIFLKEFSLQRLQKAREEMKIVEI